MLLTGLRKCVCVAGALFFAPEVAPTSGSHLLADLNISNSFDYHSVPPRGSHSTELYIGTAVMVKQPENASFFLAL